MTSTFILEYAEKGSNYSKSISNNVCKLSQNQGKNIRCYTRGGAQCAQGWKKLKISKLKLSFFCVLFVISIEYTTYNQRKFHFLRKNGLEISIQSQAIRFVENYNKKAFKNLLLTYSTKILVTTI